MAFRILSSFLLVCSAVTSSPVGLCKITKHGYGYDTFYNVKDLAITTKEPHILFEMHIAIQGEKDAQILLSPTTSPKDDDSVYEIVLGAGDNTYNELRRKSGIEALVSEYMSNTLSATDFRSFYIKVFKDGLIVIGKEGEEKPLLSYTDETPIQIKYLSFGAYGDATVQFSFDCSGFYSSPVLLPTIIPTTGGIFVVETEKTTFEEVTTEKVTPEKATTEEVTMDEVTTEEFTPEETSPEEITTEKVTTEEATTKEVTIEEATTKEMTTEGVTTSIGEFITTDKPVDSQNNVNIDENPHIIASMTIEKSGTVRASLGPLTRNETSLIPSFGILIAAIAQNIHRGYGPTYVSVTEIKSNNSSHYAPYIAYSYDAVTSN